MAEVLTILIGQACFVCVVGVVIRANDEETFMCSIGWNISWRARLMARGLLVTLHEVVFLEKEIKWCLRL